MNHPSTRKKKNHVTMTMKTVLLRCTYFEGHFKWPFSWLIQHHSKHKCVRIYFRYDLKILEHTPMQSLSFRFDLNDSSLEPYVCRATTGRRTAEEQTWSTASQATDNFPFQLDFLYKCGNEMMVPGVKVKSHPHR